jgi:hypothetical protein
LLLELILPISLGLRLDGPFHCSVPEAVAQMIGHHHFSKQMACGGLYIDLGGKRTKMKDFEVER